MGYKILIVDDEPEIRDLLHLYLKKDGYDIVEAADSACAPSAASTISYPSFFR